VPTEKHNPTVAERDERVGPFDVDPEEALEAILKVDPKKKLVGIDYGDPKNGTVKPKPSKH